MSVANRMSFAGPMQGIISRRWRNGWLFLGRRAFVGTTTTSPTTTTRLESSSRPASVLRFPCAKRRYFTTSESSSPDHPHALFQKQLEELEAERKSLFGQEEINLPGQEDNLVEMGNNSLGQQEEEVPLIKDSTTSSHKVMETNTNNTDEWEEDLEDLHAEREALFQFTSEEKKAWRSFSPQTSQIPADILQETARARQAASEDEKTPTLATKKSSTDSSSSLEEPQSSSSSHHEQHFSHVSSDGQSIHMVHVGAKAVTTRTATAQTTVMLPPEVLTALFGFNNKDDSNNREMVGPKGPIFATAKLAGIMAAKKTSDLIPLCHPLPLDQVVVDITWLEPNQIRIECTCRVTHKTGVEMEALTGATVAALTIYDMVKAVSHRVEITDTKLLTKTGGKREIISTTEA